MIADYLIEFLQNDVRLETALVLFQANIGSIAHAVLHRFIDGLFHSLRMSSEVFQDSTFELLASGRLDFASGSSMIPGQDVHDRPQHRT